MTTRVHASGRALVRRADGSETIKYGYLIEHPSSMVASIVNDSEQIQRAMAKRVALIQWRTPHILAQDECISVGLCSVSFGIACRPCEQAYHSYCSCFDLRHALTLVCCWRAFIFGCRRCVRASIGKSPEPSLLLASPSDAICHIAMEFHISSSSLVQTWPGQFLPATATRLHQRD